MPPELNPEDWEGGVFDDGSENHGQGNAFWPDTGMACPFEWDGCRSSIEAFAATDGLWSATAAEVALAAAPQLRQPQAWRMP